MLMSRKPAERPPLSRRKVIEAALAIGDAEGLDAISLRRLARELSVTPMALYRYVEDKDDLLSGVAEYVFEEFELPEAEDEDWRNDLRTIARSFRRLLVVHPMVAALYSVQPAQMMSQRGARIVDVVLGVLRRAGFSPREAALLECECERFIFGLVMLEKLGWPRKLGDAREAHARGFQEKLSSMPASEVPHLNEAAPFMIESPDPDWAFEVALDLIVGGLEHLLEAGPSHLDVD